MDQTHRRRALTVVLLAGCCRVRFVGRVCDARGTAVDMKTFLHVPCQYCSTPHTHEVAGTDLNILHSQMNKTTKPFWSVTGLATEEPERFLRAARRGGHLFCVGPQHHKTHIYICSGDTTQRCSSSGRSAPSRWPPLTPAAGRTARRRAAAPLPSACPRLTPKAMCPTTKSMLQRPPLAITPTHIRVSVVLLRLASGSTNLRQRRRMPALLPTESSMLHRWSSGSTNQWLQQRMPAHPPTASMRTPTQPSRYSSRSHSRSQRHSSHGHRSQRHRRSSQRHSTLNTRGLSSRNTRSLTRLSSRRTSHIISSRRRRRSSAERTRSRHTR